MFGQLRDGPGGFSLLAVGLALLALAGFFLVAPLPPALIGTVALLSFLAGAGCIGLWWQRRRAARYDLGRLWDDPPPAPEEPDEDVVPEEAATPYCGWCDEVFPAGTWRCPRCGRQLE
jgi:hypothetical protein